LSRPPPFLEKGVDFPVEARYEEEIVAESEDAGDGQRERGAERGDSGNRRTKMNGENRSDLPGRDRLRAIARRAMVERGLQPDFSPAAKAQAETLRGPAKPTTDSSIRDLRSLLWCSIDNDDSRDLDQLTAAEPVPGGATRVLVAIADVDSLVAAGSPIDAHARANTTSVYTPAEIFPMLPEKLSTDLTSLNQDGERLAIVVDLRIAASGTVEEQAVYRAIVLNRAKLAYSAVAAWLEGRAPAPPALAAVPGLEESLRLQDRVALSLDALRHRQGALSIETLQTRAVFSGDVLAELRPDEQDRAKNLIEEFMIAANGATARYLEGKRFPSFRRVLRSPERWERIVELAAGLGGRLPAEPSSKALEEFLIERRKADPVRFPDLSLSVVKLLGKGEYAVEKPGAGSEGHFGLAVRDYLHSTAPNRRFPDLLTQRLLKAALAGRPVPYAPQAMDELARHSTDMEDRASKVERQLHKSAAALLLEGRIGQRFEGIVTGASPKGTWVRVFDPIVEGRVVRGAEGLDVGDRTRVELVGTDVERGFIDFVRVRA
jgi:VacB/RNase II family 3'-5' exoribonuclease